jgi:hypothetical protein
VTPAQGLCQSWVGAGLEGGITVKCFWRAPIGSILLSTVLAGGAAAAEPVGPQFVSASDLTLTSDDPDLGLPIEIYNGSAAEVTISLVVDLKEHDQSVVLTPGADQPVGVGQKATWTLKFVNASVGDFEDTGTLVATSSGGGLIARLGVTVIAGKGNPVVKPIAGEWGPPFDSSTAKESPNSPLFSPLGGRAADFSIPLREDANLTGISSLVGPRRWIAQASQPEGEHGVLISGLGGAGEYKGKVMFGDATDESTVLAVQVRDLPLMPLLFLAVGYLVFYWVFSQRTRFGPRRQAIRRLDLLARESKKQQTKAQKVLDDLQAWPVDPRAVYTIYKPKRGWPDPQNGTGYIADRAREATIAYTKGDPAAAETAWGPTGTSLVQVQDAVKKLAKLNATQLKVAQLYQALQTLSTTDWQQISGQPVARNATATLTGRELSKDDFDSAITDADAAKALLVEYTRDYSILSQYLDGQKDPAHHEELARLKTILLSEELATEAEAKSQVYDKLGAHAPGDRHGAAERAKEMVEDATDQATAMLGMAAASAASTPAFPAPSAAGPKGPAAPPPGPGQAARTPRPRPSQWDRFLKTVRRRWDALADGLRDYFDDFGLPDAVVVVLILVAGILAYMTNPKFGFMSDYVLLLGGGLFGQGGLTFARTLIPKILG